MRYTPAEIEELLPLPPATFHILIALAGEDRHGCVALLMTLSGSLIPALRALRVDPAAVLRAE